MIRLKRTLKKLAAYYLRFWRRSLINKLAVLNVGLIIIIILIMYGIAEWYIRSESNQPLNIGTTFSAEYAASLGLDPRSTLQALLNIKVKNLRLVSYWNDLEPQNGSYNFSSLDWQFKLAEQNHARVLLTLGLRQPRWPECHVPDWVNTNQPLKVWQPELEAFMVKVVERYQHSPSLWAYQIENEYFLHGGGFSVGNGACSNFSRSRLINEAKLVKSLDPAHRIVIARSNNVIGFPTGQPQPDLFGVSVYKRVWDQGITHRYLEYPFPAKYYAFLAGVQKIFLHKDTVIDELQAEAWPPNGQSIPEISLAEQNKSLDAKRLKERFSYGRATGMKTIYMWGGEYWYYRLKLRHDPSLWNVAKREFSHQ